MMKNYEENLPDGYYLVAQMNPKEQKKKKIYSCIIMIILLILGFLFFEPKSIIASLRNLSTKKMTIYYIIYFSCLFFNIIVHELIHGILYKIMTGKKLTFGYKNGCAYCGVTNIYVYRKCALISLMGPFVILSIVYITAIILLRVAFAKYLFYVLLIISQAGCVFDLYDFYLLMFKYKDKDTLIYDSGPIQYFYKKENGDRILKKGV